MIEPIDYQHSLDKTQFVEKIEQARKDRPEAEHHQFAKELEKETDEKKEQVQKTEDSEADLRVKDEKNKEKEEAKKRKKKKDEEEKKKEDKEQSEDNRHGQGNIIDIKA